MDLLEFIKAVAKAHWHTYAKYVYHVIILSLIVYLIIKIIKT
jgi:hypothetical protein